MTAHDVVERGRDACARSAWADAYELLAIGDRQDTLDADDLDLLAVAAYLTGRTEAAADAWERAHHALVRRGEIERAVRCAFWLGLVLVLRGDHARGGGWLGRARHLVDTRAHDCVERGYVLLSDAFQSLDAGDTGAAFTVSTEMGAVAARFGDDDLAAFARLGQGQALVAAGETAQGVSLLDEAMVAVTTGDVSPIVAGIVYCAVIIACRDIFDLRRAEEWTVALNRWCATQQGLKPYRGQCMVHRSEIMQLRGEWADAMREIRQACQHLSDPPGDPVLGMAQYQLAELLRLRGEFSQAESAYRAAEDCGHPAQPGLALLRLAQGRLDDARAAIRSAVRDAGDPVRRSRLLSAHVEIALACDDLDTARAAADELEEVSAGFDSPYLRAVVGYARGSIQLAEGETEEACRTLRRAKTAWQQLAAAYETARVRLRLAQACRLVGDHDAAGMELDGALRVFDQLRAAPALRIAHEIAGDVPARVPGALTAREVEVLRLVATGATNRQIAATLVISERTVARHMSNMFAKLDVTSRSAATAFAYEHDLI